MFLDASAIVAILARQPDAVSLMARLAAASGKVYVSPISMLEAVLGLAQAKTPAGGTVIPDRISQAEAAVAELISAIGAKEMVISMDVGRRALEAGRQYGEASGHPAALNIGDCLAYACAQAYRLQLLAKGGDFAQTGIAGS
ncbi:type II toxin-antitoxin system VapC family toxin [Inquilinus sp. NPDC058860]|uniref:type II toxin-antitoxin system VapC family toxin n=1 Tax=Inquilinus sp. NPDC058860 TaxID=3346652 RepID=UPI0036922BA4